MAIKKIKALSPDPYINKIKGDTEFARLAHLNHLVEQINAAQALTVKTVTSAYTLKSGDEGSFININMAVPNNLTVPSDSSVNFPIGTQVFVAEYGTGQVTFIGEPGVNIRSANGKLKLAAVYSGASLVKIGANEWYAFGDLSL